MAVDRRGFFQAEAELPVVCVETRHMQAVLKAQINKTDRQPVRSVDKVIQRKAEFCAGAVGIGFERYGGGAFPKASHALVWTAILR
jgi:hypothetical protein